MEQKTIPSTRTYHIVTLDNVIDDDVADTLISATFEPSSPQYTRAITAADLPPNQDVSGFVGLVSIGGRNLNAEVARTINVQFTLNGANIAGNAGNRSITANNYWCVSSGVIRAVQAGDVLGVKMWGSVSNDLDYRYVTPSISFRNSTLPPLAR